MTVSRGRGVFGVFMIKDFKVFVQILLGRFGCALLWLVVRKNSLLLGIEQFGCKQSWQLGILSTGRRKLSKKSGNSHSD